MAELSSAYVLDSDTVSNLLRGNPGAIEGMRLTTLAAANFYLCPIVWFEIRRGLLHRDARRQLQIFERFAAVLEFGGSLGRPSQEGPPSSGCRSDDRVVCSAPR